ncbi:MAG: hypothetical protein PHS44_04315 [Candidatus Dojkabacteria bacterium]|nr:hypothetical protein [Candidatus Dojkabacteria bacterium]
MKGKLAVTLPRNLTRKIEDIQKQMDLKTPGEVILKALSLLELSMGRKVELKDKDETFEIKSFENLRQSIKLDDVEKEDDK